MTTQAELEAKKGAFWLGYDLGFDAGEINKQELREAGNDWGEVSGEIYEHRSQFDDWAYDVIPALGDLTRDWVATEEEEEEEEEWDDEEWIADEIWDEFNLGGETGVSQGAKLRGKLEIPEEYIEQE